MPENKNEEAAQQHGNEEEEEEEGKKEMGKKTWGDMAKDMKIFLWNPETRRFMGRTAHSWGVMIRPHISSSVNIAFKPADADSWQKYVDNLHAFLQDYDDKVQEEKNIKCNEGNYFIQDDEESGLRKACQFKRSALNACSGIDDPSFGYSTGQPCILLKMNRIVGYKPGYGNPVTVSCNVHKGDAADIKTVAFYPSSTFDPMYFPYYGKHTHVNYTQPLVGIHFSDVAKDKEINVQCQLNGKGIINNFNSDRFLGRVVFMLKITT
ncbi:protein ATP1B4 isoform X2 [Podarcis lilfordi]|nr:protein ATP1B4 isoform X2 [Podarcis lilfordi]